MIATTGCSQIALGESGLFSQTNLVTMTKTTMPSFTLTATFTLTPSPTSTSTNTPTPTFTPTPIDTPTPTPTATWTFQDAGPVLAPILLYHHIAEPEFANRYYVTPENFQMQMQSLYNWGYTTITPTQLIEVIINGGELPPRPVVITFDDGNLDIYENAFPVMQEFGFVGAFYLVTSYLDGDDHISYDQLKEMMAAGWEIGSHSSTHQDLTLDDADIRYELFDSRTTLQDTLSITVTTVAYPFGKADEYVMKKTSKYGYRAGLGLGSSNLHSSNTLFYLNRREVQYSFDLDAFAALLPWTDQSE